MRHVSASEAKQRFAALLDAVQREPVTIRCQNREVAVVVSPTDFNPLRNTKVEEFQRFCDSISARAKARGLTKGKLDALLSEQPHIPSCIRI